MLTIQYNFQPQLQRVFFHLAFATVEECSDAQVALFCPLNCSDWILWGTNGLLAPKSWMDTKSQNTTPEQSTVSWRKFCFLWNFSQKKMYVFTLSWCEQACDKTPGCYAFGFNNNPAVVTGQRYVHEKRPNLNYKSRLSSGCLAVEWWNQTCRWHEKRECKFWEWFPNLAVIFLGT